MKRLFICGLMDEFYKALHDDNDKAKKILELLGVDKPSIVKLYHKTSQKAFRK